jgi:hypothetical protein
MNLERKRRWARLLLVLAVSSACGGVVDPSENTSEPFPGTLQPGGTGTHQFRVGKSGEIDVRITAMSNVDALVQILYGQGPCASPAILNAGYRQANQVGIGGLVSAGDHCAIIADSLGVLRQPTTYTLTVSHP